VAVFRVAARPPTPAQQKESRQGSAAGPHVTPATKRLSVAPEVPAGTLRLSWGRVRALGDKRWLTITNALGSAAGDHRPSTCGGSCSWSACWPRCRGRVGRRPERSIAGVLCGRLRPSSHVPMYDHQRTADYVANLAHDRD
jgi:hypothetical protein